MLYSIRHQSDFLIYLLIVEDYQYGRLRNLDWLVCYDQFPITVNNGIVYCAYIGWMSDFIKFWSILLLK
jgi:hypothetical protein